MLNFKKIVHPAFNFNAGVTWIFINPVIFGKGIPLFTSSTNKTKFKLLAAKQFPNGEVA